jgi:hypothetical protein
MVLMCAILGFNALFMIPLLDSPFLGDDSWCESTVRGLMLLTDQSLGKLCWEVEKDYVSGGRWYPLVIYYYPVFFAFDRGAYKAAIFTLVLVNILLYGALVKSISRTTSLAMMAMLLPALFFQFRQYHEPILSYYGLMQLEAALILASLLIFVKYLQTERWQWLALSVLLYALNLLLYEALYFLFVAHAILAVHSWGSIRSRKVLNALAPFLLITTLNLLIVVTIRSLFSVQYEGSRLSMDPFMWAITFAKQAFAAVPLSYVWTRGEFLDDVASLFSKPRLLITWVLGALLFGHVMRRLSQESSAATNFHFIKCLGALGIVIWLMPGVLVSASSKYQSELKWGTGYLPVYVSYFGTMTLVLSGVGLLMPRITQRHIPRAFIGCCATALFAVILMVNLAANESVVQAYRNVELRPRRLLEEALHTQLLQGVPPGSYLICDEPLRAWESPAFFKMHSGITLQVVRAEKTSLDEPLCIQKITKAFAGNIFSTALPVLDFEHGTFSRPVFDGYKVKYDGRQSPILEMKESTKTTKDPPAVFFLTYGTRRKGQESAVLGRVLKLQLDGENISAISARELCIYVPHENESRQPAFRISGCLVDVISLGPKGSFTTPRNELKVLTASADGIVYGLETMAETDAVDPRSVQLVER